MIDVEVLDAMFARATHYARIGDKESAYAAYEAIQARVKISTGRRIDAAMAHIRVCLLTAYYSYTVLLHRASSVL
jgi:26S proteasome subunit RPN7